ncbi:hypothetical protein MUP46_01200, partial [Patescibacteria group bacterium]|nr:hypothetical protein [Patescibacteria group bacterium]
EKRQLYTVKSPTRYIIGLAKWGGESTRYTHEEKNQPREFILENIRFFQPEIENIQQKSSETALKSTISTKNSLTSYKHSSIVLPSLGSKVVVIKQEVRSDAEYQKIYADSNFKGLEPDDMKWVDQNIIEEIEIESDEQEKEIMSIFFDGDWDKYRKNLMINKETKK